jgi:RNA polymerase sigma factor (sigma-70 family)
MRRSGLPVEEEDLVSAGTIGLIEAVDRYEPDRGVPFGPFAYRRIRGAMIDEIRRLRATQPGKESHSYTLLSLETAIAEEGLTLIDVTVNPSSPEPQICRELAEMLDALRLLPDREREMLALHVAGHSLAEISGAFGCSESRHNSSSKRDTASWTELLSDAPATALAWKAAFRPGARGVARRRGWTVCEGDGRKAHQV